MGDDDRRVIPIDLAWRPATLANRPSAGAEGGPMNWSPTHIDRFEQARLPRGRRVGRAPVAEILENDQGFAVEFKSTARWDLREDKPNKTMEDAVVKTVAGFLNTDGGTVLIGVGPDRQVVGLDHDYPRVKPPNGDGFVNWLTTHLTTAVGHAAVMRSRARIVAHDGHEICRLEVARSSRPVWATTSKDERVFFVRMNNSTRPLPEQELNSYIVDRWPGQGSTGYST